MFGEAFDASGFSNGRGPAGETAMGMEMSEGGKMYFLLHLLLAAGSTGHGNTSPSLSAGVWKPKVFRGR